MFDDLLELIAPTRCSSCDLFGQLICDACLNEVHGYSSQYACLKCAAPYGELVCTECWDETFNFSQAVSLGPFEPPLSRAVVTFKDKNERRLGRYLGFLLGQKVSLLWKGWGDVIAWVPPSRLAVKRRGFDHGELIARGLQQALKMPIGLFCTHQASFDLRKLNKEERKSAVKQAFSLCKNAGQLKERNIVLVDDVMTTGATLNEISGMFLDAGAREVRVAVVARTW